MSKDKMHKANKKRKKNSPQYYRSWYFKCFHLMASSADQCLHFCSRHCFNIAC